MFELFVSEFELGCHASRKRTAVSIAVCSCGSHLAFSHGDHASVSHVGGVQFVVCYTPWLELGEALFCKGIWLRNGVGEKSRATPSARKPAACLGRIG